MWRGGGWQCRIHYTSGLNPLSLFRTQYSCGPSISTVYWALSRWITWSAASSLDSTLSPGRLWGPIAKDGPVCTSPLSPHQPCPCYHISFRCLEATRQASTQSSRSFTRLLCDVYTPLYSGSLSFGNSLRWPQTLLDLLLSLATFPESGCDVSPLMLALGEIKPGSSRLITG